ncbi:SusC/RagA family TonB-linked outer membrane protein [Cochleicola gelatinilyticus]|uniref:SusC/RagA family TonB-linked outer membrane protein n=1 Tax=Cochleicola gelatinilyticus TaxID=1763537 RepID=A0A167HKE3_9FLAO|nr:TonB-dependent receptor [Cochleicola gelatinilyticus]OAB78703.1 SusC/RagA family TonB-linked outer membrane protein [Cochleicola gelatinilyticus]
MKHILKSALLVLFLLPLSLFAQSTVTGTITESASGLPIPGANVVVKGTTNGASTDFDGNYTLSEVATGDVLVFSYVGFEPQEINFSGQSTLSIALNEDAALLDEVVLIGYGSTTKQDATGAVQKVSSEEFNKGAIVSPDQLLAGKSAGVRITSSGGAPGEGSEIRIRGGSSLSANNSPLIVVDGIPLDQRGVQGVRNQLNSINPNEIEDFVILKDASATAIYGSRASNGVVLITTKKGKKGAPFKIEYGFQVSIDEAIDYVDVFTADEFRTLINENGADPSLLGNATTDWQDEIYRTAVGGIHNLTFSQGFENFSYRINYNNTNKQGILRKDLYRRNALNVNLNASLFDDHLKFALTTKGSFDDNFYADTGAIGNAIVFDPTQPIRQGGAFGGYFEFTQPNGNPEALSPRNPVALLEQNDEKARNKRNITNLNTEYRFHFLPELKFISNAGFDYSEIDGREFVEGRSATQQNGQFQKYYTGFNRNTNLDLILNYKNTIATANTEYDVTAGHSYQEFYVLSDLTETRNGMLETDPTTINRNSLESYFGRVSFDIADKYLLSASYRRDGSSRFKKENRWGNFPAASIGWKISNEEFLKDSNAVSNLKLRAGYGVTGNQEIGTNYGYLGIYSPGQSSASVQFGDTFQNTLRPEEFDENLKWEETTQYNVGLDIGFVNNAFNVTLDGYYRETEDLLARIPTAAGSNLSDLLTTNVGETLSRGVELGINTTVVSNDNFNWDLNANATLQEVEITKLNLSGDPDFFIPQGGIAGGVGNNIQLWRPGFDPTTFFVFRQVYDSEGNPIEGAYVDVNGDNQITEADRQAYKKATPDVYLGFTSNMSYKNFDFGFTLRGSLGNYVYNNVDSNTAFYEELLSPPGNFYKNGSKNLLESNFNDPQLFSDYYISRADFLKMDNMSIGYLFPMEEVQFRASFTATNVFTITKYDGLDPEISNGIDNNFYPRPRGFVLGLNFTY